MARFMRNTLASPTGCLLWTGPLTPNGYGKFRVAGERERVAHRVIYEHFYGPIPDNPDGHPHQLDHSCHTEAVARGECAGGSECVHRRCVNRLHLEVVTASENTLRQDHANRRKTHCPQGHEYTPENTRIDRNGKRHCRTCDGARKGGR